MSLLKETFEDLPELFVQFVDGPSKICSRNRRNASCKFSSVALVLLVEVDELLQSTTNFVLALSDGLAVIGRDVR